MQRGESDRVHFALYENAVLFNNLINVYQNTGNEMRKVVAANIKARQWARS